MRGVIVIDNQVSARLLPASLRMHQWLGTWF